MSLTTSEVLVFALQKTCAELCDSVTQVPLRYWYESVFRFLLIRHLREISPTIDLDCEWDRFDLVLNAPEGKTIVELKFWPYRGLAAKRKGGPSPQNYKEYKDVLSKLGSATATSSASASGGTAAAFLILVYVDPSGPSSRTFGEYYDKIAPDEQIRSVRIVLDHRACGPNAQLTCKLLEVGAGSA